ncbi:carbonic anhydrase [Pestalotiopsis sp. NC0098]|nr:carbonic anhydrase [Pestalotiopsis sp. NC0098]
MSTLQQNLEKSNAQYAAQFTKGHLALPPAKKYLVLTCMDARIDPASAFGIELGDAHVIRNAGASARDALRSIIISEQLLGTREIILIKHTGCGMLTFQNDDAHGIVKKNLGDAAAKEVEHVDFLPFADLEQAVRDDIAFLKGTETVPKDVVVSGWVYEVETGKVRRVD